MKNILVLVMFSVVSIGVNAYTKQEILDHTIKISLIAGEYSDANEYASRMLDQDVSKEIADFAAQLIWISLQQSSIAPKKTLVLLKLLEARESSRYNEILALSRQKDISPDVNAKIDYLLEKNVKIIEEPFQARDVNLVDFRWELIAKARDSHGIPEWDKKAKKNTKKMIKKLDTYEDVVNAMGYPSNLFLSFRYGRTGVAAQLVMLYPNRVRIALDNKYGDSYVYPGDTWDMLNSLEMDSIDILDDYSDPSLVNGILLSDNAKYAEEYLESLDRYTPIENAILTSMASSVKKQVRSYDRKWEDSIYYMCGFLGRSGDIEYADTLHNAATELEEEDLRFKCSQFLLHLYADTGAVQELMAVLNSDDTKQIWQAARMVHKLVMLNTEILDAYMSILERKYNSSDKYLVSGMVTMVKSLNASNQIQYLDRLIALEPKVSNRGLHKHLKKAIGTLSKIKILHD
ncbi:hypothetical protein [Aurantivibrio plasticivorans]